MYFQPYGDDQQLNLNWIINEIINLHKQLDPNYETPSFTQVYPYSNLNRLNLDWVLSELKALKELAPEPTPTFDIQAVAEALVALPFDSNTSYQIYDFISKDGEIWRATEPIAAGGEWDETKWFKTKIGTDLAVLERWINAINNSLTAEIQARQDADTALQNTINGLTSADISDDSDAGGATVKLSLNALKGSLNDVEKIIAPVLTEFKADTQLLIGDFRIYNKELYIAKQVITAGTTLVNGQNVEKVSSLREALTKTLYTATFTTTDSFDITVSANLSGVQIFVSESTQKSLTGRSGWTYLTNLPTICIPTKIIYMPLFTPDTTICFATIMLNPNGSLNYQPHTVTNQWLQASSSCILF